MHGRITSVAEFYAHALAIEHEASERYAELQRHFADRGEEALAGLCGNLARLEREHFTLLVRASRHMPLPAIAEGEYQWLDSGSPEAPAREVLFRIANPRQLLEVALQAEHGALAFFEQVVKTTRDPEVRALAREMAAEEARHVQWVRNAIEYHAPAALDTDQRGGGGVA